MHREISCIVCCVLLLAAACLTGCWSAGHQEVVVYTALDAEFSEPLLQDFEQQSGIRVQAKFDVESVKTVGLANAIMQESNRPRCDVFWNNEILHMLRLEKKGLLDVYRPQAAAGFPAAYRSPRDTWYGFAARARVLLVNTERVPRAQRPKSIHDLVDPRWRGEAALAKPLFGTTATHAAVLFAHWGDQRAREFFLQLRENARILGGNKQVAQAVAAGQLAFGLTDTDDAIIEQEKGFPVEIVFPDQQEGGLGTLFIPNTVGIIRRGPHPAAARTLMEFLLSREVERRLAAGRSAQFPLHPDAGATSRAAPEGEVTRMEVDFTAAADKWTTAATFLRDHFTGP